MSKFEEPRRFYTLVREYGAKLDRSRPISIQIAFQEYYGAIPHEIWEMTVPSTFWARESPEFNVRADEWLAQATQQNVYPDSPLTGTAGPMVELYRRRSNGRQAIIIPLPSELIAPEKRQATYNRLEVLFAELWRRAGLLGREVATTPADAAAAEEKAETHLLTIYGNDLPGEARFISGGRDIRSGTWTMTFTDIEGTRYEVTLEPIRSIPTSCRVRKNF